MGVTVKELRKMMEQGQLMTKDFLPKFTNEVERMTGKIDATNTSMFQMSRMFTAFERFGISIWEGGLGEGLTDFAKNMADILPHLKPIGDFLGIVLKGALLALNFTLGLTLATFGELVNLAKILRKWMGETFGEDNIKFVDKLTDSLIELSVALMVLIGGFKALKRLMGMFGVVSKKVDDVLDTTKNTKGNGGGKPPSNRGDLSKRVRDAAARAKEPTLSKGAGFKAGASKFASGIGGRLLGFISLALTFAEIGSNISKRMEQDFKESGGNYRDVGRGAAAQRINRSINQSVGTQSNVNVNVEITPNSGEFSKAVDARVNSNNGLLTQTMLNQAYE